VDAYIGEWTLEASFAPAGTVGRTVFEWTLGRQFVVERPEVPGAPDSVAIIGYDPGREAYCQHFFDSRGIARVHAMDLADGVWTLLRDSPDFTPLEFSQRFTGTFSGHGRRISGRWEHQETARAGSTTLTSRIPRSVRRPDALPRGAGGG
jgi:hypothetical protein